jgi:DNA (cytosine-5)-methyltransferase 1
MNRIGHPIPPFPPPEHGPDDSGLKRFRTVQDVLAPLKRPGYRMQNDKWHQPDQEKEKYGVPYDPSTQLSGTLTTGGSLHHSGKRVNTVRELLLLQGFRIDYFVCGSKTKAREGAGNAWSPIASEKYLLQCAATTEAFENGFIDSEEHVDNLYNTLENNGIVIPSYATGYRYLCQLKKSTPLRTPLRVFGKRKELAPVPRDQRRADTSERSPLTHRMRSLSIVPAKREETPPREDNPPARDSRQKRPQKDVEKEIRSAKRRGNFIDLD